MVDELGYQNLLEGRIPMLFYMSRVEDIRRLCLRKHARHWCNGLILQLLEITHRQWTFHNGTVHLKGPDGLMAAQQCSLANKCEALLWTDPSTLLSEDRYLLDVDFEDLGDASASSRQMWLAEMDAAWCAACYADGDYTDVMLEEPQLDTPVDTEGSIQFCRRRRRHCSLIDPFVGSSSLTWMRLNPYGPGCCSACVEKKGCCPLLSCVG
jgi:hypothetical protein